jgi:hypothetical protein
MKLSKKRLFKVYVLLSFIVLYTGDTVAQESKIYLSNNGLFSHNETLKKDTKVTPNKMNNNEIGIGFMNKKWLFELSFLSRKSFSENQSIYTHKVTTNELTKTVDLRFTLGYGKKLVDNNNLELGVYALLGTMYQPKKVNNILKVYDFNIWVQTTRNERPNTLTLNGGARLTFLYNVYKRLSVGVFMDLLIQYQNAFGEYKNIKETKDKTTTSVFDINEHIWTKQYLNYSFVLTYNIGKNEK